MSVVDTVYDFLFGSPNLACSSSQPTRQAPAPAVQASPLELTRSDLVAIFNAISSDDSESQICGLRDLGPYNNNVDKFAKAAAEQIVNRIYLGRDASSLTQADATIRAKLDKLKDFKRGLVIEQLTTAIATALGKIVNPGQSADANAAALINFFLAAPYRSDFSAVCPTNGEPTARQLAAANLPGFLRFESVTRQTLLDIIGKVEADTRHDYNTISVSADEIAKALKADEALRNAVLSQLQINATAQCNPQFDIWEARLDPASLRIGQSKDVVFPATFAYPPAYSAASAFSILFGTMNGTTFTADGKVTAAVPTANPTTWVVGTESLSLSLTSRVTVAADATAGKRTVQVSYGTVILGLFTDLFEIKPAPQGGGNTGGGNGIPAGCRGITDPMSLANCIDQNSGR